MSDVTPEPSPILEFASMPDGIPTLTDIEAAELVAEYPALPRDPDKDCITCRGKKTFRWYTNAAYTETGVYACPCDEQYIAHRYFLRCGIPLNYQRLTWTDIHTKDAARDAAITDYIGNAEAYIAAGIGMVLTGDPGTGKTFVSGMLLKRLLSMGYTGRMMDTSRLVSAYMNANWGRDAPASAKVKFTREVLNTQLLVIDDLGRERQGGSTDQNSRTSAETVLEVVFRHRVQACLPTIISTNRRDLHGLYGQHITNVLDECAIQVDFNGTNGRPATQQRTLSEAQQRITRPIFYGVGHELAG